MVPAKSGPDNPRPDPSLPGRIYLLLQAALRFKIVTTDDCLLPGEANSRRQGNPKILGVAVATAHRKGWVKPAPAEPGCRTVVKSSRRTRANGPVERWIRTETTAAAFERFAQMLTKKPSHRTLFDPENDGGAN